MPKSVFEYDQAGLEMKAIRFDRKGQLWSISAYHKAANTIEIRLAGLAGSPEKPGKTITIQTDDQVLELLPTIFPWSPIAAR